MNSKSKAKIIEKIKKCFAMAGSSSPAEAAIAMRQAKKLMDAHGLQGVDADFFELGQANYDSGRSSEPAWLSMLCNVVAKAFGCSGFCGGGAYKFVGPSAAAEVAAYTLEILHRSCKQATAEFRKNLKAAGKKSRGNGIDLGNSFALGWVMGVNEKVKEFAAPLSSSDEASHANYIETASGSKISGRRRQQIQLPDGGGAEVALMAGYKEGKKVELHAGVGILTDN
jgi:hypothetical protein